MNWMFSCRRVAELLSQQLDEPLGLFDLVRLRVHMSMCSNCRNVGRQMGAIRPASAEWFAADAGADAEAVPPQSPQKGGPAA